MSVCGVQKESKYDARRKSRKLWQKKYPGIRLKCVANRRKSSRCGSVFDADFCAFASCCVSDV